MTRKQIIITAIVIVVIVGFVLVRRRRKANASTPSSSNIPAAVLAEPAADWTGETLTYQGVKYTPVNGVWTIV